MLQALVKRAGGRPEPRGGEGDEAHRQKALRQLESGFETLLGAGCWMLRTWGLKDSTKCDHLFYLCMMIDPCSLLALFRLFFVTTSSTPHATTGDHHLAPHLATHITHYHITSCIPLQEPASRVRRRRSYKSPPICGNTSGSPLPVCLPYLCHTQTPGSSSDSQDLLLPSITITSSIPDQRLRLQAAVA